MISASRNKLVLALAMCLFGMSAIAQNLTGTWNGYVLQDVGGLFHKYEYEVSIVQTGNKVKGESYIHVPEQGISCRMKFEGVVSMGFLYFVETAYLDDHKIKGMDAEWCLKKGGYKISSNGTEYVLIGMLTAKATFGDCIGGASKLKKIAPRA